MCLDCVIETLNPVERTIEVIGLDLDQESQAPGVDAQHGHTILCG
jgi:hypothetical protein